MFYLLVTAALASCDLPVFRTLPAPAAPATGHGVVTGEASHQGLPVVGGHFSRRSAHPVSAWKVVLADPGSQDQWLPAQFGYDASEVIDPEHVYLAIDLSFLGDVFRVRRQLVVEVHNEDTPTGFQSCWWMVDPVPFYDRIAAWRSDAEWERAMLGRWEVRPDPAGGTVVEYQWWAQQGKVPTSIMRYAVSRTLPDLLDAFDRRVGEKRGR